MDIILGEMGLLGGLAFTLSSVRVGDVLMLAESRVPVSEPAVEVDVALVSSSTLQPGLLFNFWGDLLRTSPVSDPASMFVLM